MYMPTTYHIASRFVFFIYSHKWQSIVQTTFRRTHILIKQLSYLNSWVMSTVVKLCAAVSVQCSICFILTSRVRYHVRYHVCCHHKPICAIFQQIILRILLEHSCRHLIWPRDCVSKYTLQHVHLVVYPWSCPTIALPRHESSTTDCLFNTSPPILPKYLAGQCSNYSAL